MKTFDDIETMSREELMGQIMHLRKKCDRLEERVRVLSKYEWSDNSDRMGGQFTEWEINRRGDEFS